jgi:hypothetical protein
MINAWILAMGLHPDPRKVFDDTIYREFHHLARAAVTGVLDWQALVSWLLCRKLVLERDLAAVTPGRRFTHTRFWRSEAALTERILEITDNDDNLLAAIPEDELPYDRGNNPVHFYDKTLAAAQAAADLEDGVEDDEEVDEDGGEGEEGEEEDQGEDDEDEDEDDEDEDEDEDKYEDEDEAGGYNGLNTRDLESDSPLSDLSGMSDLFGLDQTEEFETPNRPEVQEGEKVRRLNRSYDEPEPGLHSLHRRSGRKRKLQQKDQLLFLDGYNVNVDVNGDGDAYMTHSPRTVTRKRTKKVDDLFFLDGY